MTAELVGDLPPSASSKGRVWADWRILADANPGQWVRMGIGHTSLTNYRKLYAGRYEFVERNREGYARRLTPPRNGEKRT